MTKPTPDQIERTRPFIARLERVFGAHPHGSGYYAELALAVGGYAAEAIDKGASELLRHHEGYWPKPAECRRFVDEARKDLSETPRVHRNEIPDGYRVTVEQAKRMLLCEEGYAAALEGYHVEVFYHIRKTGDFPDARALREIVAKHRAPAFIDRKGKEWSRKQFWEQTPGEYRGIKIQRDAVLARRKQLKEYILEHYQSAASAG